MRTRLLNYLCDPIDGSALRLDDGAERVGDVVSNGILVSETGHRYEITNGVPRFVLDPALKQTVASFGEEWNHFNYDRFKANWLAHIANGAFGSPDYFRGKVIVDCAAGSCMHARWMSEYGADYVIALELSDSVDGVVQQNLRDIHNVDVVQCSIDAHPIRPLSIHGLVICNAAIQHTPNVERTAKALWRMVGSEGELAFSCYARFPSDPLWMARYLLIYRPLRAILSRCSFRTILAYAKLMARLRFVPLLGPLLEKANFMIRGDVPLGDRYYERLYESAVLNTFDWYGSHKYQHQLSADELAAICSGLEPKPRRVLNIDAYRRRPVPPGLPIRLYA
ncbi:class I SAM-dependent methyltransferase [Bradyrhizobium sp. HKCCYLS2038]|uniref:class I SAM-dependent methyltransferase n=1 Tax=unclassified Bradyrhizobium TaxID=2631580 RepID=UPI003EB7A349